MNKTLAMKKQIRVALAVMGFLLLSVVCSPSLRAQVVGATLSGTITDSSGGLVANAVLTILNDETGVVRTVSTNEAGVYSAPNLQPGNYTVTTAAAGFASESTKLTLTVGSQQTLNMSLKVGTSMQTVEVSDSTPNINLVESTLGGLNTETQIKELPLNGRSWTDLAILQPGVTAVHNVPNVSTRDRESRGYGDQITVSGARPQQNNYRIDGVSINDPTNGAPGSVLGGNLGVDAISEFSVLTTNYSTQYGRASGGIINATTKSGTNQFHGDVYEFLRNSALDASNYFDIQKPPFKRNQFGASVGGPIKKDKTFIFGDYEGLRQVLNLTQNSAVPSANARNGILSTGNVTVDPEAARFLAAFYPLPNTPTSGDVGSYIFGRPQVTNENYFIVRADQIFSEKDILHGTYMFDRANTNEVDEFKNKSVQTLTHRQVFSLDESHSFGSNFLNDARFGLVRYYIGGPASATAINPLVSDTSYGFVPGNSAGQISIGGITNFTGGLSAVAPQIDPWTDWQGYEDANLSKGIHSLKFGGSIEWIEWNRVAGTRAGGQFNFASLPAFLTNHPQSLTADAPNSVSPRAIRQKVFGLYIQDDIRFRPNLTFNVGVRYEPATLVTELHGKIGSLLTITDPVPHLGNPLYHNNTLHNIAPRVGFAWDPFKSGKTSVRAGFGLYDQLPLPAYFGNPESNTPPFYESVNASKLSPGDFPINAFLKATTGGLISQRVPFVEQYPGRSYVMQYNFSIQRELARNLTLLIGYVGSHGVHGITNTDDANIVLPIASPLGYLWPCEPFDPVTGCGGIGSGTRLNPFVGREPATLFRNSSVYNGLNVQVTKRITHGLQAQGSFTWQKSIDTASGNPTADQYINGISSEFLFDPRVQRAVSDFNVGKVLTLNAVWDIPTFTTGFASGLVSGWQMSGIFTASTGVPFTPLLAGDPLGLNSTDPFAYPDRLNTPGCKSLVNPGNVQNYLKVQCFAVPPAVVYNGVHYIRLGNAGRNEVPSPGLVDLDFSLVKNTYIKRISETFNVQFRAEVFNILNHPNFNVPVYNGQQVILDPTISGIGIVPANPLTDVISQVPLDSTSTTSRQLQFAIKVIW
jgi:hypothetical protein